MKRFISLLSLIAILSSAMLISCGQNNLSVNTSSSYADSSWLENRIGKIPDNLTVGTSDSLGIDMSDFENDGYFIRTEGGETVICGKNFVGLDKAVRSYARSVKYNYSVQDISYHEGARIECFTINGHDISEYTVVYTHTDTPTMPFSGTTKGNGEYAATEFVRLMKYATGIELPMSDKPVETPYISFEAVDSDEYGLNGYSYEVKNGNLFFRGAGKSAGVSNGVYMFFERECGWSGLTYGDSCLAENELVNIPEGTSFSGHLAFQHFI